ncbi:MAG: hypothetical protein A2186_03280 [Candidatus Levybacteria bacterium RIFOXYA1_FULL_41_10]|nr:MAG: glycosyl transferase family 1 protein [Candidatus Levybacteria bacterium GW2011_GWA2_36_13]KKR17815.1 MAG: glycosyl transferase family 1 protein [Candidatus Levybacteria bacterium GW2011_GWA1_39_32]KKR51550.1 MAG: glycosyl transferase family 1 protein [Candidatus Levybacteria bacterium GW2011_GWC1_40_19]KKS02271.1 MAG: glycosyl transferase family 1 protein [Candidatus Levybacteria bacterium GW2011_GWB1_41_21]OGH20822.1 MAG: hypothetical protein A2695_01750 [Candidatus Levybacteria bacte
MKILLISSFLPYPLLSGGNIRLYNILKYLQKNHEVVLVCEKRSYQKEADIKRVEEVCSRVITVPRKKQWSVSNILKTAFSKSPFLLVGHESSEIKKIVSKLLEEEKFDLIHVETFYVMHNLPKTNLPVVLVEHNIEYLIYERFARNAFPILRPFLMIDVAKLKREEEKAWDRASALVAVSKKEKELMGRDNVEVVPNGADVDKFKLKNYKKGLNKKILFIGDFKYIQNQDSARWIIRNIWPLISANNKNVTLWIVGKNAVDRVGSYKREGIVLEDNPTSKTEDIFQQADILLAPIRVGGGTSLKILEAMASGLPVVTTLLGNEGIGAKDSEEIIVAEEPWEFSNKITDILWNEGRIKEIGKNARVFIEKNYKWEKITEKLNDVYERVVK